VSALAVIVLAGEKRVRPRGAKETDKIIEATGAIVGAVLRAWRKGHPIALSLAKEDLTILPGGRIAARVVLDQLEAAGVLHHQAGVRFFNRFDYQEGRTSRYWPSPALLERATGEGITAATVKAHFVAPSPTDAPAPAPPIVVRGLTIRPGEDGPKLPLETLGEPLAALAEEVESWNAWARTVSVTGCRPPQWGRVFKPDVALGGRWYALGAQNYQTMNEEARLGIRIGAEVVAELDVKAAALSIMFGLLGQPLPEGDLYAFDGYERDAVKSWVTASLGNGSPVKRWPKKGADPVARQYDPVALGKVICARYPFLSAPAESVAERAALKALAHIGKPRKLLGHRLQAIEAQAVTQAMRALRTTLGVLALPVHDSLIVPQSAASAARTCLEEAFWDVAGVRVRVH
jgi:hypothetical protein